MAELARLSMDGSRDVRIARLAGELDASNASRLTGEVLGAVPNDARALVLDLSETTYIDSSGISLIFDVAARMKNRRQELRLVVPPKSFPAEVLTAVSVEGAVTIDPALSDALR